MPRDQDCAEVALNVVARKLNVKLKLPVNEEAPDQQIDFLKILDHEKTSQQLDYDNEAQFLAALEGIDNPNGPGRLGGLDKEKPYMLRTGMANHAAGHFQVLFFDEKENGWKVYSSDNNQAQVTRNGKLVEGVFHDRFEKTACSVAAMDETSLAKAAWAVETARNGAADEAKKMRAEKQGALTDGEEKEAMEVGNGLIAVEVVMLHLEEKEIHDVFGDTDALLDKYIDKLAAPALAGPPEEYDADLPEAAEAERAVPLHKNVVDEKQDTVVKVDIDMPPINDVTRSYCHALQTLLANEPAAQHVDKKAIESIQDRFEKFSDTNGAEMKDDETRKEAFQEAIDFRLAQKLQDAEDRGETPANEHDQVENALKSIIEDDDDIRPSPP